MSDKGFSGRGSKSRMPWGRRFKSGVLREAVQVCTGVAPESLYTGTLASSCLSSWSCVDENRNFRPAMPFAQASMVSSI